MCLLIGLQIEEVLDHINDFKGVHRRFNIEVYPKHIYIDDYAHHPTEIKATIEAARLSYPTKKIVTIYKPDRVSRIHYFEKEFKEALLTSDKAYVMDFPATAYQEDPNYHLEDFLIAMGNEIQYLENNMTGIQTLAKEAEAVYLFVSPKDIYKFKDQLKIYFDDKQAL